MELIKSVLPSSKFSGILALILFFSMTSSVVFGQHKRNFQGRNFPGTISGSVIDSASGSPLEGAAVRITRLDRDSSRARGNYTDSKGDFSVKVPYGTYKIEITYTGYKKATLTDIDVSESKAEVILNTVKLASGDISTEEINVEGQKPLIEITPEKKIINVENNIITVGETVIDMLKKVPLVQVDNNNNISLRGSANVKLLIDGKESAMTDFLDQMPADMVKDIELITNPPAKYESEGLAGIINIVLKENTNIGLNGSISATAANYDKYNGSANFNMRKDKVSIFGNFYYGTNYNISNSSSDLTNTLDSLSYTNQNDINNNRRRFSYFSGGMEYRFSKEHSLNLQGFFGTGRVNGSDYGQNSLLNGNQNLYEYFTKNNFTNGSGNRYHLSLTYNGIIKKEHQLSGNVTYSGGKFNNTLNQTLQYYDGNYIPLNNTPYKENDYRNSSNYHFNSQLDYVLNFSKVSKLETGYKGIIRYSDNNFITDTLNYNINQFIEDLATSNEFKYKEQIYALYAMYGNIFGNFSFKAGVRGEQTYTNGTLVNDNQVISSKYFDLFPSLNLSEKLGEIEQIQASYSRRIQRPNNFRLNPFVNRSNPLNLSYGNPNLKPQFTDSYELNFVTTLGKTSITPSLFYKRTHDLMTRFSTLTDSNVTVSTFVNVGSSTSYGLDLIVSSNIFKWWILNGTMSFYDLSYEGGNLDNFAAPSGYSFRGNFSTVITLPNIVNVQMYYNYNGKRYTSQGTIQPVQSFDIGISKQFFNNSLTVLLKANDIFKSIDYNSYLSGLGFTENNISIPNSRTVQLTVTYNFGKHDKQLRRRKQKNNNDEDKNKDDNIDDENDEDQ